MSNKALTYDDIQLVPAYSEITSRKLIDLKTKVTTRYSLDMPIVASPMPTVCGLDMAIEVMKMGGVGCIHRFMSIESQASITNDVASFKKSNAKLLPWLFSISLNFLNTNDSLAYK